jgi:hypothetical protein
MCLSSSSNHTGASSGRLYSTDPDQSTIDTRIQGGIRASSGGDALSTGDIGLQTGRWCPVAFVVNRANPRLYSDGVRGLGPDPSMPK